ncbi:sporozoite cysteine-rich [Cryptosporidium bovis]|uniref:sporozoite cysteine-rich n=1 Tax=Cryptosporidium bovis TaxID=310047 RepID=UPI003519DB6F|nr:sporozoite cysteine-rich [Cryptosporidium bovis]
MTIGLRNESNFNSRLKFRFFNNFVLVFVFLFVISNVNSIPPSFQWERAWKDVTSFGLSYKFGDSNLPWYSGTSFRIVGKFTATNVESTLVTIQNGSSFHCILKIDYETQTIYAESANSDTGEKWTANYAYFPFPYSPTEINLDLVIEKLRWPGGFYFYLSGNGPYYPCRSVVYSSVDLLTFGDGKSNFKDYSIKRNIPLSEPYRRVYLVDGFEEVYNFKDSNLYYVNSTGIDDTSGVPNDNRVPSYYEGWPDLLEVYVFSTGMYPLGNLAVGSTTKKWGGSVAVTLKDDQSQYYYRTNGYYETKSVNSYCTSSNLVLGGTTYLVDGDYPFDYTDPANPYSAILIKRIFGVDVFIRESLWSLGTLLNCGRHAKSVPESVRLIFPDDFRQFSTTRFAVSPIDCEYSQWSSWLPCTSTCAGGTTYRWRYPLNEVMAGGLECTVTSQTSACNTDVDCLPCSFTEWGSWSACSVTCGGGITARTRELSHEAPGCQDLLKQTSTCNNSPCPVDCVLSHWSPWSDCSKHLCDGTKYRYRVILQEAENSGTPCPLSSQLKQVTECINTCEGICQSSLEDICQNGGECISIGSSDYYCKCSEGYYGRNCTVNSNNTFNIIVGNSLAVAIGLVCFLIFLLMNRS